MLNTSFMSLLNVGFIQSNLPDLQTQEQLLKDRFEKEKTNGYNFELVDIKREPDTVKLVNKYELENKEYSLQELDNLFTTLLEGLVDGIIRRADIMKAKSAKISYSMESMLFAYGQEMTDSKGFVFFDPSHKSFNYITQKEEISPACLLGIMLVTFSK